MMHSDSRASLWALIEIYSRLLRRIDESGYDVVSRRIRLSNWEKARILIESRFRA
jgi:phytoene/squalene synthetase